MTRYGLRLPEFLGRFAKNIRDHLYRVALGLMHAFQLHTGLVPGVLGMGEVEKGLGSRGSPYCTRREQNTFGSNPVPQTSDRRRGVWFGRMEKPAGAAIAAEMRTHAVKVAGPQRPMRLAMLRTITRPPS